MAQLVKYRTVSGTAPRIPIQDVVLNMSRVISADSDVRTGRGVLVYQNDVEISTIYTSEVASYTKSKMTGYVTALMVKYDVFEGEKDQYFVVDQIVYAIRHPSDPYNKTDIYVTNGTDTLVNKVTIMASLETLLADANQVSFNGATWGQIGGNIGDQLDLQNQFSTKVNKTTTLTINSVTYDLSANRSWTISGAVWGSITGTLSAQTDLQSALDTKVPTARTLTINGTTYDLSANRSWTIASGISIGDTIGGGTAGRVLFQGATNILADSAGLKYSDSLGLEVQPTGLIVGGYTAGLNIKGADPTMRITTNGGRGFGIFGTGTMIPFFRTADNWASVIPMGGINLNYSGWGFGGINSPSAIVHAKSNAISDVVIIAQGIAGQINDLQQWNVGGTVLAKIDSEGNATFGDFTATKTSGNLAGALFSAAEARMSLFSGGSTDADASLRYFVNGGALGSTYSEIGQNNSYSSNAYSGGAIAFDTRGGVTPIRVFTKASGANPINVMTFGVNGNVAIGLPNTEGTAFVDIAASTTTRASLRLRSGTLPTVPNAGDISYDGAFKGWNGSTWLTFGGGGGGISIGDTITGASTNSVFFYNGGLAQAAGFTYTTGTSTLAAVNTVFTSIQATNPSNLNIKDYTGAVRLTISIDGTYFLGVGQVATNTSFGNSALRLATGGADNNTAFGYYALASATGSASQYNSAFGTSALTSNTTGYSNNAFGRLALGLNTTGLNNVAMGHTALYSNTTGVGNVGVGLDANRKGTTANYNTTIGTSAMYGGTTPTGGSNVAIGYSALENYTTGQWNVAIGSTAGTGITTGSYNVLIGTQGSTGIITGSYNTIVGKATGLSSSLSNTIIVADGQGNKGFEWTTPRFTIYGDTLNINTAKTPASSGAAGTTGDIVWDNGFVYVCVATNTWKRAAIITF